MAPRKTAKHSDTEIIEKAGEAGDVSNPKKKKTAVEIASKGEEEKQMRLPRAAKLSKTKQPEATNPSSVTSKNAKGKSKAVPSKNASASAKSSIKSNFATKRSKDDEEKTEKPILDTGDVKDNEETQTKMARTKTASKKAGMDADEEVKGKTKGKPKKNVTEDTENSEAPMTKRRRNAKDPETNVKESKPTTKTTKKKENDIADGKSKVSSTRNKSATNNDNEDNSKITKEPIAVPKINKKTTDDKSEQAPVRKTRRRKNEAVLENLLEEDKEPKVDEEALLGSVESSDTENQESHSKRSKATESIQASKKGKNIKKKEENVSQKKVPKTRKTANRDGDLANNEESLDPGKVIKDSRKKVTKENTSTAALETGQAKKAVSVTSSNEEHSENVSTDEKPALISLQTLVSNNNMQKTLKVKVEEEESLVEMGELNREANDDNVMSV